MWVQQEEKWNLEREARERLLTEVLVALQRQLEEKLEANLAEQRDLVKSREELVAHIEQVNAELKEQRVALNRMKEARKKEIDIQVHSW
jgi:predicted nuclease with TOPRIM domain